MASCGYCGSTILFGGTKQGNLQFCNGKCQQKGTVLAYSNQIPIDQIQQSVREIHSGLCPKCQGSGPVDVHTSHQVYSLLLMTSWKSIPRVCCRSCGLKNQLLSTAMSLVVGWWGFPWGLIMTPVQIARNISGMISPPDPMTPSAKLENAVRITLASRAMQAQKTMSAGAGQSAPPPLPS